ncbi:MAG: STAS-like domain-containing protein [Bacteroidota bacterium]|nr:STAS-like domain-containing protein [Bacteroidota bacterium]
MTYISSYEKSFNHIPSRKLGSSIQTREASSVLMNYVKNNSRDNIEFDFTSVGYISRSFADQFFDRNKYANELKKNMVVSNASDNVIKMLQAIAKSQDSLNTKPHDIAVYKYSSYIQLENFLLSFN